MAEAYMAGQKPFLPGKFLCTPSAFRETPHLKPAPVMELQDIPAMNSRRRILRFLPDHGKVMSLLNRGFRIFSLSRASSAVRI